MGVIITEDCITRPDGTLICWDRDAQQCYALKKTELTTDELSKDEWLELVKRVGKPKTPKNNEGMTAV